MDERERERERSPLPGFFLTTKCATPTSIGCDGNTHGTTSGFHDTGSIKIHTAGCLKRPQSRVYRRGQKHILLVKWSHQRPRSIQGRQDAGGLFEIIILSSTIWSAFLFAWRAERKTKKKSKFYRRATAAGNSSDVELIRIELIHLRK